MAQDWLEVAVFIHGITPDETPKGHQDEYNSLYELIKLKMLSQNKKFDDAIYVEWGKDLERKEQYLLENSVKNETINPNFDPSVNFILRPLRKLIQNLIFRGFGDLFYYFSAKGETEIRDEVFSQIYYKDVDNKIPRFLEDTNVSLTFFTHSAGGIITHDFLYQLFRSETVQKIKEDPKTEFSKLIRELRKMQHNGHLRVRRFYTMGSPIAPVVMRSKELAERVMSTDDKPSVEEFGLQKNDNLPGARWTNFWDQDDPAAYPISHLYKDQEPGKEVIIKDEQIDVGDALTDSGHKLFGDKVKNSVVPFVGDILIYLGTTLLKLGEHPVHSGYWYSDKLAEYVANNW